jgi:hypothetical protein
MMCSDGEWEGYTSSHVISTFTSLLCNLPFIQEGFGSVPSCFHQQLHAISSARIGRAIIPLAGASEVKE